MNIVLTQRKFELQNSSPRFTIKMNINKSEYVSLQFFFPFFLHFLELQLEW
jgi:hypothetical protein